MTFEQEEITAVALKAYGRIVQFWHLSQAKAAALAGMSASWRQRPEHPMSPAP